MSKTTTTPFSAEVWPCPPSAPDALAAHPEFNQQNVVHEINRVFRACKPVSTISNGLPPSPGSAPQGVLQIAVDPALPMVVEMVDDPENGLPNIFAGILSGNDYFAPKGRKAGIEYAAPSIAFLGTFGFNVFETDASGSNLVAKVFTKLLNFQHATVDVGTASATFNLDHANKITGLTPIASHGRITLGNALSPGRITLSSTATAYLYLDMNTSMHNNVTRLVFSSRGDVS